MKRAAMILAALSAIMTAAAAPVRTATESFVTNKIAEAVADIPEWAKSPTKPTYTAADVGALPINNTDQYLSFGILTGTGISLTGSFYNDDYPGMVRLRFGNASYFGCGLNVQGRVSISNSDIGLGPGELFVNGTNVMDAIAAVDSKVENAVLPTNPAFSNAVLAVGLNIDTNSVAVLNDIAETFGGFPIEGTATTVGGLLAALAAAAAWLKKNKVGSFASVGGASATVENGVAKLESFFTESNSLLTGTVDARLPYPLYTVPSTGLLKDRAINTTSLASVTVPDSFTDLLIRATVASSLSVTMPEAIATKYGDTFPGEAGEYLITITKTGAAEAYVRTIKLEEVA